MGSPRSGIVARPALCPPEGDSRYSTAWTIWPQEMAPLRFSWRHGFTRNMPTRVRIAYALGIVFLHYGTVAVIAVAGILWITLRF